MVVVYFYNSACAACLLVENFMQKHIIVFLKRLCMHVHACACVIVPSCGCTHTHMKMGCYGFLARGVIINALKCFDAVFAFSKIRQLVHNSLHNQQT